MIKNLKPCPFCGSTELEITNAFYVECLDCRAYGPTPSNPAGHNWRKHDAREAWNRRIGDEKPSSEIQPDIQPVDYPAGPQEGGAPERDAEGEA